MKHYIIDGNNLIGKIEQLRKLQMKDGQSAREKLAYMIDGYFLDRKVKITIHFDGHVRTAIRTSQAKIEYSGSHTADDMIKREIEHSKNPRNLTIISSDHELIQFASKCSCTVIQSQDFASEISRMRKRDEEESRLKGISTDEIKKLFGL